MLLPTGIAWVGLSAQDQVRLIDFYSGTVGLRIIERADEYTLLDAGGGAMFEIWGGGFAAEGRKNPQQQSVIIGFQVANLELAIAELSSRGLSPDGEIGSYKGTRWIHYKDPEGNRFELKDFSD
jgi:predicted enzyme related to lactoylglutathione lyase